MLSNQEIERKIITSFVDDGTGNSRLATTFDYKPGFKWLAFRAGHNTYAQQSAWTTQALINFVMYCRENIK